MRASIYFYIIFCCIFFISCESRGSNRPNIIFIMSDDHSEAAISVYGSNLISTPNIDRIANEGARFNNSFVYVSNGLLLC